MTELQLQLTTGKLYYKLQLGAVRRGISEIEYLERLIEEDNGVTLKTFALQYKGRVMDLARALGVTKSTIMKWRCGEVAKCRLETRNLIYKLYGVTVKK